MIFLVSNKIYKCKVTTKWRNRILRVGIPSYGMYIYGDKIANEVSSMISSIKNEGFDLEEAISVPNKNIRKKEARFNGGLMGLALSILATVAFEKVEAPQTFEDYARVTATVISPPTRAIYETGKYILE